MEFFLQQAINGIALGAVYALFALGISLVLASLDVFNVAHEGVITWGAILAYWATVSLGQPWLIALVVAVVGAALINGAVYLGAIRRLQDRPDRQFAGFIAAVGIFIMIQEIGAMSLDRQTVRLPEDVFLSNRLSLGGGVEISADQMLFIFSAAVVFAGLYWLFNRTQFGRGVRAVAYDREVASLMGLNVDAISVGVFLISGACAGLAAISVATAFNVVDSNVGGRFFLLAIAVTVIGGFGSLSGALVAGVGIGLISSMTTAYWTTTYRDIVVFVVMLAVLWVKPKGLFRVELGTARV